ncbi:glycoside hydrolase family 32 protein [Saccharibacillus sp. JS10]|uniref:glycoside hydrolase family 32 protein n=1 Tax=Saccharibacillus sp. JS10 TaxID=2950552 RepID=UPI002108AF56|nr:glycoside hydrolase family 32 protein [Saccharibacillus sp. JS10]MCQ4086054.1 glycoside hydrolase family 32 protein [Saccharibacillus sp. JS10]
MHSFQSQHLEALARAEASLAAAQERVAQDRWRLRYHVAAPAYWINDPNGFSFYRGEYHLFYQHHPYSVEWGPMYWGHVKSKDLVHWEHLPIALAPSEDYDRDGCFSGSAIEHEGKLWLMYTGNVWTGEDRDEDLKQVQALAYSEDGVHFEKYIGNPVIEAAPEGNIHPFHFRDPKIWQHEDIYYCILGSQTTDRQSGQVLLYRSADLINWTFISVIAGGQETTEKLGYMWECPDLFALGDQDVLVCSPQGMAKDGDLYHNLHQSGCMLGKLDYATGKFEHGDLQLLDYGFDFYAPQTTLDEQGRRIVIAWMAMWEDKMPEQARGWAGAMTIPRVLTIEDGQIRTRPLPELSKLRGKSVHYTNEKLLSSLAANSQSVEPDSSIYTGRQFAGVSGEYTELEIEFEAGTATSFGIAMRVGESSGEETVLSYDCQQQKLTLDRERSGAGSGGIRRAPLSLQNGILKLRIFIDRSSVEVFAGDGEVAMSARIYPGVDSTGIRFFAKDGETLLKSVDCWTLDQ